MDRVREAAVNSHPRPGDPNPTLSDYLQEIDGRGNGTELPPGFGRLDEPEPLPPTEDPAAVDEVVDRLVGNLQEREEAKRWYVDSGGLEWRGVDDL